MKFYFTLFTQEIKKGEEEEKEKDKSDTPTEGSKILGLLLKGVQKIVEHAKKQQNAIEELQNFLTDEVNVLF
jgi:hypothetical protein